MFTQEQIAAIAQAVAASVAQALASFNAAAPATNPVPPQAAPQVPSNPAPVAPAPAPTPAPPVAAPVPAPLSNAELALKLPYHSVGGDMVMDIVPSGTLGTVTLPVTGHVLSVPARDSEDPKVGESPMAYIGRVCFQAGVPAGQEGMAIANTAGLIYGFEALFNKAGIDRMNPYKASEVAKWPLAADIYFNGEAYMTPAEKQAQQDAQDKFNQAMQHLADAQNGVAQAHAQLQQHVAGRGLWQHRQDAAPAPAAPAAPAAVPIQ